VCKVGSFKLTVYKVAKCTRMLVYAAAVTFIRAGCVRLKSEHPRRHQRSVEACRRYGVKAFHVLNFVVGKVTTTFTVRGRFLFPYETN
jgi:hypothetical protein